MSITPNTNTTQPITFHSPQTVINQPTTIYSHNPQMPPLSEKQVIEQKNQAIQVANHKAKVARDTITRSYEAERAKIIFEADRSLELSKAAIEFKKMQDLMALEQNFNTQRMAIDSSVQQEKMSIEQTSLQLSLGAQSQKLEREQAMKMTALLRDRLPTNTMNQPVFPGVTTTSYPVSNIIGNGVVNPSFGQTSNPVYGTVVRGNQN